MAQINEAPPELPVTIAEPVRNLVYACIAKRPEDRPASTGHLARAAQALRRGDVAGAIAAVPGVAGHDPIAAFSSAADTSAATRLLPAGGAVATPGTATAPAPVRRRNPWTWPLVAIVSVLAVVLIAIVIFLLVRPTGTDAPTTPSTTPSQSKTPTPTPTPTATSTLINAADYVGKPFDQVSSALGNAGYEVTQAAGPVADTPNKNGTVSSLDPTGNVPKGKTIKVFVYQDYPGAPSPQAPTAATGTHSGGDTVAIGWTTYTGCPSGYPLAGYTFTVQGATLASGNQNPQAKDATSLDIVLSNSATQATVTYVATCGSGLQSSPSGTLTIPIS